MTIKTEIPNALPSVRLIHGPPARYESVLTGSGRFLVGEEAQRYMRGCAASRPYSSHGYWLALAFWALAALALVLACAGCSNTTERHEHLIRAGRILLRHSTPEAGWESRRETWLAASEIEAPDAAPVESGK